MPIMATSFYMRNKKLIRISGIVLVALFFIVPIFVGSHGTSEADTPEFKLLSLVKSQIKSDYVEPKVDETQLEYGAIKGLLGSLDDPYTRFMEPKNYKEMTIRMSGEFFGIGIHIGMRQNQLMVIAPILGTPAAKAGLKPLDEIMTIDGEKTEKLGLNEAVSKIRGKQGTKVVIGIRRLPDEAIVDFPIVRDKILLKAVEKVEVFKKKVGYIQLATFESQNAPREFEEALNDLKNKHIQSLIVDLRYNGGGLLRNAIQISGMFLDEGAVVHTVDRNGDKRTERVSGGAIYKDKLVMLINEGSASASEILAGAIKDNKRGVIVGSHSFGKASVQKIMNLPDGSAILYTIAKYYTPSMTDISKKGIKVDLELKIPTVNIEAMKKPGYIYSYDTDYQLQKAIEIASAM